MHGHDHSKLSDPDQNLVKWFNHLAGKTGVEERGIFYTKKLSDPISKFYFCLQVRKYGLMIF